MPTYESDCNALFVWRLVESDNIARVQSAPACDITALFRL